MRRLSTSSRKRYTLQGESVGRSGCTVLTDTGHTLSTDVPRFMGGRDLAPQPVEVLLTALLGCKTATAHYVARHLWDKPHNRIEKIEWRTVVGERDNNGTLTLALTLILISLTLLEVRFSCRSQLPLQSAQG